MLRRPKETSIYVATSPIDFRKAINGLTAFIAEEFDMPVADGSVYVFYNRSRDKVKCLFWDKNGFVLYQKRLERGKFKIIHNEEAVDKITLEQLDWLLAGLEYKVMAEFPMLDFSNYF